MTAWWYWALFALLCLVMLVGVPLCGRIERRADERDAEVWARMPGATR